MEIPSVNYWPEAFIYYSKALENGQRLKRKEHIYYSKITLG